MKRIVSLLLVLLLTLALVGCGGAKVNNNVTAGGLADALHMTVPFDGEMKSVSVDNYLNLPEGAEAAGYMSKGSTAEEIFVVRCASEADAKTVKTEIEKYVADQRSNLERYQPEEVSRLNSGVLIQKGVYAVLCVSADAEKAEKIIKEQLG
ncbi:MAG: DUF4358 domain-containing protein [Oscillospiraceae bacterium]|nr:DUF4358 domain-containing protein [Oscillospiraceae bacterium]